MPTSPIRLTTLGRVSCTTNDGELHSLTAQPRRVALLLYLVLAQPRGFHSRDQLLALFWPDHEEQRARNALSQALHFIRRAIGAESIVSGAEDHLRIDPTLVWCDVIAFENALTAGRMAEALDLYRGPFFEGFHISAAAGELERWIDSERVRLSHLYARALQAMAGAREAVGDFAGAVEWHRKLASHDPLSARVALALIRALAAAGEPEAALQHARIHATLSREEVGAPPDPAIVAFVSELRERMAVSASKSDRAASLTRSELPPAHDVGPSMTSATKATVSSTARRENRPRRQAMIAIGGVLVGSLALAVASRNAPEPPRKIDCVAVLPTTNISGDSALDYFADALTAATINDLGRYESPKVRPRASILALKGSTKALPEIGRALNCDGIVAASLTKSRNVAHVDAQILYAPSERYLWAESYEGDTSQLLFLERRVIEAVTRHVRALAGQTPGTAAPARRIEPIVYAVYLRGRDAYRSWNSASVHQAVALYQQAISLDSSFAPAYAGLADAYSLMGELGYGPPSDLDSARTFAERALALDSLSSEAHATKGYILTSEGDWTHAEAQFRKAIELDRANALAHLWYAVLLAIVDRREEALREVRLASDLDPMSQEIHAKRVNLEFLAGVKVPLGNPGNLRGWANPTHPIAWATRAIILAGKGQCAEAYQENQRAQELAPNNTIMLAGLVLVHRACKDSARAKSLLAEVKRRPDASSMGIYIAIVHAALHEPDSAFAWLNQSRWGTQSYYLLREERHLDGLRSEPRFVALLQRLHMPADAR